MIVTTLTIYSASDIFMPAIAHMAADLGISEAQATSNYTFYYLVLMLSYAFLGPLCESINQRRILLCSVTACLMGCVLSASAQNMLMMNTGRSLQALATGLTMLTTQLWIAGFSDKSNMVSRLAWFTLITTLAPVLAPVLGGLITDHLSWRYSFWLIAAASIVIIIILATTTRLGREREGEQPSPSTQQTPHIWHNYVSKTARSYWWALRHSPLEGFSLTLQGLYMSQGVFISVASFLFTRELGISASSLGLLSSIIVAGFVVGRFPTMYLRKHHSVRTAYLFNASFVLLSGAALVVYYLITGTHSATGVIAGLAVQAIGFSGMAILSLNNCLLTSGEAKGAVSGLYNFMNQGASLLGILLVQLFFAMGLSGMQIFQATLCLLLAIALLGTWLFLKTYPNYKDLIE